MVFKGTVGTNGTVTSLPTAAKANTGYTYKVITNGTYANITAKAGDTLVSDGSAWVLIPSGDEPNGTVTNVATGTGLTGGPITTSGTISLADSGVTAGSYGPSANASGYGASFTVPQVMVDAKGRVTSATNKTVTMPSAQNIPSVGNGTVKITQNGVSKGTFTMNQTGDTTIDLTDNNTWHALNGATASTASF